MTKMPHNLSKMEKAIWLVSNVPGCDLAKIHFLRYKGYIAAEILKATYATNCPPVAAPGEPLMVWNQHSELCSWPCKHSHVHYRGAIPCTGPIICSMCGTLWDTMEEAKATQKEWNQREMPTFALAWR